MFAERLLELLRSKLSKTNEDLDTIESIEVAIKKIQKNLHNLQAEVPAFYVWGENPDTTEALLKGVKSQVDGCVSEGKLLISKTKDRYTTTQQLVPIDIGQQLSSLELLSETVSGAMEEKDRELKRARTVRTDYKRAIEEIQCWIQNAELKVQDRTSEPLQLKENLSQIQSEIGGIGDKLDFLAKSGHVIMDQTNKDEERDLIKSTISNLSEQLAQVKSWLEEKKLQVGESLDSWQRFMTLYKVVKSWVDEKQTFLFEPLELSSLTQARQKLHDYSIAAKSCKQVTKNLSDMSKELETIAQVTSVGDLPEKLQEAEETKGEVENQLLERNALLQETSEEWEQCERKMKDVRSFIDKSHQALESPQNKKRPLRDQLGLREKMLLDIPIQKTKLSISVEKLQLHFRSGVGGDSKVTEAAEEIIKELDQLTGVVKEQTTSLEACLAQLDQYQQEIQQLRQQIIQVEQQLRIVLSPTYSPHNREKAVEEQNASLTSDVVALQQSVAKSEVELSSLPASSLTSMFDALVKLLDNLQLKEQEAIRLERVLRDLPPDAETQSLEATLAGVRTQIVTLMSQIEQGKTIVEVAQGIQEKRQQEVLQYQTLLTDLEQWLITVTASLHTEQPTSPQAIKGQLVAHEKLSAELDLKEAQLLELANRCEGLQGYPDIQQLALALSQHIRHVQEAIHEAAKELKIRQDMLQTAVAAIPVGSLSTQDRPLPIQVTTETVFIREDPEPLSGEEEVVTVGSPFVSQHELAAEDTLASDLSTIPDEEVPVKNLIAVEFELKQEPVVLDVGSQTGNSLLLDQPKKESVSFLIPEVTTKVEGTICHPSVDMEVQTESSSQFVSDFALPLATKKEGPAEIAVQTAKDSWTSPAIEMQKNKIHVFQKITGDEETIEIATKAGVGGGEILVAPEDESTVIPQEKHSETGDDLLVKVKYKGKGQEDTQSMTSTSELNIIHTTPQSFETLLIDPGESTMEVIVDKDGNQKIVVRRVRQTVISQQQQHHTVQQRFETFAASDIGSACAEIPVTQSVAFSEVTLQGLQSTVSESQGDGKVHVTTTKSYTGKVAAGIPGGDLTSSEFSTEPQHQTVTYRTFSGGTENLPECAILREMGAQEFNGNGYTVVEPSEAGNVSAEFEPEHIVTSQPEGQDTIGDQLITTSTSSVHAVVQQVTRRVVRRTRRVIRKVVIVDGKEHVTEEVVEEPEEVEVEVPRVRVEISRTGDSNMGQQIQDSDLQEQYQQYSPGDVTFQVDSGFVPRLTLQEGEDTHGNVFQGRPGTEIQDAHIMEEHKPSSVQEELVEVSMDGQTPVEKQEYMQGELVMKIPGSLHKEEEEVIAGNNEVNRLYVDEPEELPDTSDAKLVPTTTDELKDQFDKMLLDTGESVFVQGTCVIEGDINNLFYKEAEHVPETGVEHTSLQQFTEYLAVSEVDKDSTVVAAEELTVEKKTSGEDTVGIPEQENLHTVIGTEGILPNTSSRFDSVSMKFGEVIPKTEPEPVTKGDSDVKRSVKEQSSEVPLEKSESPYVVQYEAVVTGVTHMPTEPSSDIFPALECHILPELKETQATQEPDAQERGTELQDQCVSVEFPEAHKYFDTTTVKNVVEETLKISELTEDNGTVVKVISEETKQSQSTEQLHTTPEDPFVTDLQSEPSAVTGVRTSEVPEGEHFIPGVVFKSMEQSPKPSEFKETVTKTNGTVSQDVTSQTSPEQGIKTIEFALSVEEKAKPSLKETAELIPKVSSTVQIQEKELTASSEDKRDEPSTVTVPEHEVVKEDIVIQLPSTKTVSHTVIEEIIAKPRPAPTSLKTESEPWVESSSKSEVDISTPKKSKKRRKHKAKGLRESSPEESVEAEQVKPPEQMQEGIIHNVSLDRSDDLISVETSLAESTEIIIPGSPALTLSDTTKATEEEIVLFESPISPHALRDGAKTHDTGYDPEDKTTLDEMSLVEEDDRQKNKKKKKRKQKVKAKESEESTNAIPESSAKPIAAQTLGSCHDSSTEKLHCSKPEEASTSVSESAAEKVTVEERGRVERQGKKRKKDKKEPEAASEFKELDPALDMQIADTHSPEFCDESYKTLKSEEAHNVKIMEEALLTRPPSEASDALVGTEPKSVDIWELLHVQEKSAQTVIQDVTKTPDTVMIESSVQTIKEQAPVVTQEDNTQTVTPELPVVERTGTTDFSVQTLKEELTPTQEGSVQTKTPEVVELHPVLTNETSIQTVEMEPVLTHEEAAQTSTPEAIQLVSVDTVESSIQTKAEELIPVQEGSSQTLTPEVPVIDTKDTSIQTVKDELTPLNEGSMQTIASDPLEIPEPLKVETFEMSVQTSKEEMNPIREEYAYTGIQERPVEIVEMSSQTVKEDSVQTLEGTAETVSPEVTTGAQVDVSETSIQTIKEEIIPSTNEYCQTVSSEVPQAEMVEITEISTQTTIALVPSTQEEYAQTLSPEVPDVTETSIQTLKEEIVPTEEQYSQTVAIEKSQPQHLEMSDSSIQTKEEEVILIPEEVLQAAPPVMSEPKENTVSPDFLKPERTEMTDTGETVKEDIITAQNLPETTVSHVLFNPVDTKVETTETSIQTKPVLVKECTDERSQSSSSEDPYEIHVQTSISFVPSVEPGDIWKTSCDTSTGVPKDREPRTSGDNFVSPVRETEQDGNICSTEEMPLTSVSVKSAQPSRDVLNMPGMEMEPVTDLRVTTEEHVEPSVSVTDLPQTETKEDTKKAVYEFIASEIGAQLKDRESRQQTVKLIQDETFPDHDSEGIIGRETPPLAKLKGTKPEEKHQSSKDRKSKHKKKHKEVYDFDSTRVLEPVSLEYQEQTKLQESTSEPTDSEEAQLAAEVSCADDLPEVKPESLTAKITLEKGKGKVVITTEREITSEDKIQHPEGSAGKKSKKPKKSSKAQKNTADINLEANAERSLETQTLGRMSDEEISSEFQPSYSPVAKQSSEPEGHMEEEFLSEERKVSGQPVRGEHSPGPPIAYETVMATKCSPDPDSDKELELTGHEPNSASTTEQFLIDSRELAVDTSYVTEKSVSNFDMETNREQPVAISSGDVIPVAISELESVLQEQPSPEFLVTQIKDSVDELEMSKFKSLVFVEDTSVQLEPNQPSDAISIPAEESATVKWKQANNVLSERVKNLQNAYKTSHMSAGLYLATLQEVVSEEPVEQKSVHVQHNLSLLRSAVENKDVVVIQKTIITTIETISTWLETIEYRVYLNKQKTNTAPTQEHMKEYDTLKEEISNIEENVDALEGVLETASGICNEDDKIRMKECLASLQEHVKAVEKLAQESEEKVAKGLIYWEEFLNGVNNISVMVEELKQQLEELVQSDISAQLKLQELEKIETVNCCHMLKTSCLLKTARSLVRDYPGREIPPETYTAHETTRIIEHSVSLERERLLQLLSLADDYEQTLKEFSQIVDVAETLVDSPISVISLEHLQEEMQKHRKFFVNLSHCRGILESLEGNLDPDTRALHSQLHQTLHCRATAILDKAASRAQQMALAASRWTVLEQGMKEERGWLQVAHQRVPDLQTVNSSDYDQYISLYQSLSSDVAVHHARIVQLLSVAHRLQELITCIGLEARYDEHLEVILRLQDDVNSSLRRLLAFRDTWSTYDLMIDKLEFWMKGAEKDLDIISTETVPPGGNMRQFWELKAQYEVHNNIHNEAGSTFESAMRIIPVADEMLQRQFHAKLEDRWRGVADRINRIQTSIIQNLSSQEVPFSDKLSLLEQELQEVKATISEIRGIIKNEEELNLYIERLQVLHERVEHIEEELGRLGLMSATESEKVSTLLYTARQLDMQVSEELEGSVLLREKLQAIHKGLARVTRNHERASSILDQCEASEKLGSDVVEQAVINCQAVAEELVSHWQDLMTLRQLLHTLPMCLRLTVSPVQVERQISQLQDEHTTLETRCDRLLSLLRARLALWRRFERQLEMVQQSVQEADYMMELLTVQGSVDYDRLLKATERLEGLYGSLDQREDLLDELRAAAEPLTSSCDPEVSQKIEAAVQEAVTAWNGTCQSLLELCNRYQDAVKLWKQYREASDAVKAWVDQQLDSVAQFKPEEALRQVKVCEETLAAHKSRLGELKGLVAQIANDVGLEAGGLLEAEVDALGKRLEDVRESLATLVEAAESRAANKDVCTDDLLQTKSYLSSVQQSLTTVEESTEKDVENQLGALRSHLLALGRTEGQLQALKEKSLELAPAKPETSVVEILQLWQQVFRETFQQYHRLSARLVKSQDGAAALRLWQEYLLHVQSFLSGSIPEDYHSLTEHQHLCEVHQNLLTSQQSVLLSKSDDPDGKLGKGLVELSVTEQFNSLTNLHNETLARIMERHGEVRERLAAWDRYRQDQARLLCWLRDTERERGRLQLRYIHTRRVPKMLQRIESLLDKVPTGESQAENLQEQQSKLLHFCDDALATSIRMEHAAISQRISNLQAGLETWKGFLKRVALLTAAFEDQVHHIENVFKEIHCAIAEPDVLPLSHTGMQNRLENLRLLRSRLVELTRDLEELGVTQEQLKECVSPVDMKTMNQKVWLLWQGQGDLDHHLAVLCHQLEEKLGMRTMFDNRQSRFLVWASDVESRVDQGSAAGDPEEVLRRLETELQAEVALKTREVDWLLHTGSELIQTCAGDGETEVEQRKEIEGKVQKVHDTWDRLQNLSKSRANKLHDILQTISQLELRIAELRAWLYEVEAQLKKPLVFESCSKEVVELKIQEHEKLQKEIEKQSGSIADVLNLCELLLSDSESCKTSINTESITVATEALEKRWKNVCGLSAEKKQQIISVWALLQEVLKLCQKHQPWLDSLEQILKDIDSRRGQKSQDEIQDLKVKLEDALKDIESHGPALQILDQTYVKLEKDSGMELDNLKQLTSVVRSVLLRWHQLQPTAVGIIQRLDEELQVYRDFLAAHEKAVLSLIQVNVQLTQIQQLASPEQAAMPRERLLQIEHLESELEAYSGLLRNADELGLVVMERSRPDELPAIQEMIDEYQLLWKDIKARIAVLKTECQEEIQKRGLDRTVDEVDESVQVETLRFEQDSAVQVDTLPSLTRITSRDAYLYELETAILECTTNLDALEDVLRSPTPQQGSRGQGSSPQMPKLIATCQSSVELTKHLSTLLIEESHVSEEYARTREVHDLIARYDQLVAEARAREQRMRESSESARLTCPLCSRKNWQQLDNDLWRLEQWLQYAEGTQSSQTAPPSNIEQLEDTIQDHREFLMDLESHKNIVVSLNIVGTHLADHTEDAERAEQLRARLVTVNTRWDAVCRAAAAWQTQLQTALMENHEFHQIIEELVTWLEKTENVIRQAEPIDLTDEIEVIEAKYNKFRELRSDLERCEPRVMSLQEAADQLLRKSEGPEGASSTWSRLTDLRLKLQSLRRLTGVYIIKLGAVLGRDASELGMSITTAATSGCTTAATSLMSLSQELLDQAVPGQFEGSVHSEQQHKNDNGRSEPEDVDTTVLARGYRFLGRVVRASLPIQALMLLLLGVAALVPTREEDYSCILSNNFARSLEPMLRYPNGPPPI